MLQRFDSQFLRDFRNPATVRTPIIEAVEEDVPPPPPPPPPPTFSAEELSKAEMAAKEQGYVEGFEAGLKQAQNDAIKREQDMASALAAIVQQFKQLAIHYQGHLDQHSAELTELALTIARKVAEDALDTRGGEVIATLVKQCLPLVLERPKITIELHSATQAAAEVAVKRLLSEHGYEGDVIYRANDQLAKHHAKVDWVEGQATRSPEALWQEIETLIYPPTTPTP